MTIVPDSMPELTGVKDVTNPDADVWRGLRLHVRQRCAAAIGRLIETGALRRQDIMDLGEVSINQASLDLREIQKRLGNQLIYDVRAKHYRLKETA
jgi:hypothetical protein